MAQEQASPPENVGDGSVRDALFWRGVVPVAAGVAQLVGPAIVLWFTLTPTRSLDDAVGKGLVVAPVAMMGSAASLLGLVLGLVALTARTSPPAVRGIGFGLNALVLLWWLGFWAVLLLH